MIQKEDIKMKKIVLIILIVAIFAGILAFTDDAEARKGCARWDRECLRYIGQYHHSPYIRTRLPYRSTLIPTAVATPLPYPAPATPIPYP